jgi:ribosomal protein S18 acetylase RimI-like enzyme
MTVFIRSACIADISAIVLLNRDVQQLHADLEPTLFKADAKEDEISAFFRARLADTGHKIHLAEADGEPVGYVWFEVQDRPETPFQFPRKRIYIHHLSVKKTARRTGVGSALLGNIQTEAVAAGIASIALDTWAANASACHFFEDQGFEPFNLVLRKHIA